MKTTFSNPGLPVRTIAAVVVVVLATALAGAGPGGAALATTVTTPPIVPQPVSISATPGAQFTLTPTTRILTGSDSAAVTSAARALAGILRPSTGYPLPIAVDDGSEGHDVLLQLGGSRGLGSEGYRLDVAGGAVVLSARTAAGLFHGVQTLRQLLPPPVEASTVQDGPWTIPGVHITDHPRFAWRGAMLDVARHFFDVGEVKRYIDLLAMYKVNVLHLHLADDQGWRIEIDSWPRLASYGGSTEVGGGPGGYYTKEQYAELVRYAQDRHILVVPEIDMPGHTNAALASYAELNCDGEAPPLYTGTSVGFSSLCIHKDITYTFVDDVVRELAAMTPGPYIHIGGDEAHVTPHEDYVLFVDRVEEIVGSHGKRMSGWEEITGADVSPSSVAQFWFTPREARDAAAKGMEVVMSPAQKAYLDMKYDASTPLGLSWAGFTNVQDSFEWDPATFVPGLPEQSVLGPEAPLWSETLEDIDDIEYMAFPRMAGIAEIGWSPAAGR
ncbi:MAG: beta-N-acetylhexosaminidase, partial [Pseudonocardiaceae bacterium]